MVLGHNLHYMALFEIPRAAFCMVFRCASFVCSCPGADFGAQDQILDPQDQISARQVNILAGDLFGLKKWSRKKLFCGGMVLWWGFRGIQPAQMNSMVPRSHMGRLLCPEPPLKNNF